MDTLKRRVVGSIPIHLRQNERVWTGAALKRLLRAKMETSLECVGGEANVGIETWFYTA